MDRGGKSHAFWLGGLSEALPHHRSEADFSSVTRVLLVSVED